MQRNLTVRARPEQMSALLQLASLPLEVIKLAVDNDMNPVVLVRDRLIAGREVNDAQPRMAETRRADGVTAKRLGCLDRGGGGYPWRASGCPLKWVCHLRKMLRFRT
jgi:hypothetical protein